VNRPRPTEDAVREALHEEAERTDAGQPGEDGSTDEGAGARADESPAPAAPAEAPAEEQPREDELSVALRERGEYLDLARRTQADFENYRKRSAKDVAAAGARARAGLIRELLPAVDNLERALQTAPEGDPMADGVRLVLMDLQGVLTRAGVESIEPKGEAFDPNVHEALTTRSEEGVDAGVVLDVVEKGYRSNEQVIRPARVVVAA
jgi:molecular chaperone GrpE